MNITILMVWERGFVGSGVSLGVSPRVNPSPRAPRDLLGWPHLCGFVLLNILNSVPILEPSKPLQG